MFRKLFLAQVLLLVLALATFGLIAARGMRHRMMEEFGRRLEADAELLGIVVQSNPDPAALQVALQGMSDRLEVRLTVIAADGRVIGDSGADPSGMDNHNGRPEVIAARRDGKGAHRRMSGTLDSEMMYVALRQERPPGVVVRAALPVGRADAAVKDLYGGLAASFSAIGLLGAWAAYLLSRRITQSLREIQVVADWIAAGDFTRRAPHGEPEEVRRVATAINRMADELAARLEALRGERSKLEAVISSMEEGVIALDASGGILYLNGAGRRMFELRDDSRGLRLWEAVRLPGLEEAALGVLKGGPLVKAPYDVGARIFSIQISPVSEGRGAVAVARDITEDRRYDNLRKEFVANVSHELRTPLSVIQGYVETLLEGAWRDEKSALEFLGTIDRNARRLAAIVQDLLDLSRLESGGRAVEPRPLDLRGILDRIGEAYRPVAERRRQELVVEIGPGTGFVMADAALLERAVSNLVDNALKYTPERGRIRIRSESPEDAAVISVEDNGMGIPEADIPRIFERFYRVDKSRSRDLGGTGLGLAIVKHIVHLHGGSVTVKSALGHGSTFTLRFPSRPPR